MACPVKFRGRLLEYIGKILRPANGKRAMVYAYLDSKVGVLKHSAKARQKTYKPIIKGIWLIYIEKNEET
jgi:hypothetical protein